MHTFFDLAAVTAIAEQAHSRDGQHASLVWQLAAAPVLSTHPADPDAPPVQVYDHDWLTSRWPQLTVADIANDLATLTRITTEHLNLTGDDHLLDALQRGTADGWTLLDVDVDESEIAWSLARSRSGAEPRAPLGRRERACAHPLLARLSDDGFVLRNFPVGADNWIATRRGRRYEASLTVTPTTVDLLCYPVGADRPGAPWSATFPATIPTDIAAAITVAVARIGDDTEPKTC